MLSGIERRLNFENQPVRSRDIKGVLNSPPTTNRGSQEPATNRVKPKSYLKLNKKYSFYEGEQFPLTTSCNNIQNCVL